MFRLAVSSGVHGRLSQTLNLSPTHRGLKFLRSALRSLSPDGLPERSLKPLKMSTTIPIRSKSGFPNSYPSLNPIDTYREHISTTLGPIVGQEPSDIYPKLQWTLELKKGDLTLAAPALQIKGTSPQELASKIGEQFHETDLVEKPVVEGIHIQFFFKPLPLANSVLSAILNRTVGYGMNHNFGLQDPEDRASSKKHIVVEFSSPNIAKPFHAGHLRSTIIGGFIAKLYEANGLKVTKINYLGDWGKQFGLLAGGFQRFGSEAELNSGDAVGHLFDVYVKINQKKDAEDADVIVLKEKLASVAAAGGDTAYLAEMITEKIAASEDQKAREYFRLMEDGDPVALALWTQFRNLSIVKLMSSYARLNIEFDDYAGESKVPPHSIKTALEKLRSKGYAEESDGALIVDFSKWISDKKQAKKLPTVIVEKRDGTSTYISRDVAELRNRHAKYKFDKMIYVVAGAQETHFNQIFKLTEFCGDKSISDKATHITFGLVKGMSTRKGQVKFLDDILAEVGDKMHEVMKKNETKYNQVENAKETADILGITAVMVQDMKGKRVNGYTFDINAMTSFEGDTGPYLQYAHARLSSIYRKASLTLSEEELDNLAAANTSLLVEPHAVELVRLLSQWPDVVQNTLKTLEPSTILTYLFKMTHALSSSYDVLKVVGSEPELLKARLALYEAARQTLNNGMTLLGLSPVERM